MCPQTRQIDQCLIKFTVTMRSYCLKLSDRDEGPFSEEQVSQLFADGRADRNTPCRLGNDGTWKTIDDYLPMLKYGTQLPNPTSPVVRSEDPSVYGVRSAAAPPALPQTKGLVDARVSVVDFDLPFGSILKLMFTWMAAAFVVVCCFIPALIFLVFVVMAIFGSLLGGMFSALRHP